MPVIRHLFISPGHNYFGHHGQPPGEHPIAEVAAIDCVPGRGIRGDRFFDYKEDYKGQVTLFDWAVFLRLRDELGLPVAPPSGLRRNVLIEGLDLAALVGRDFELGPLLLTSAEECRPCYWMDRAFQPGAEDWLRGRGGLRARIRRGGELRCGTVDCRVLAEPAAAAVSA